MMSTDEGSSWKSRLNGWPSLRELPIWHIGTPDHKFSLISKKVAGDTLRTFVIE
jgi:hypothetical protein